MRADGLGVLAPPWDGVLGDFDYLIPPCPDTDVSHRRSGEVLKAIDIRPRRRRQSRQPPSLRQFLPPSLQRLVNRLHSLDPLQVRRHAIDRLSIEPISHAHGN